MGSEPWWKIPLLYTLALQCVGESLPSIHFLSKLLPGYQNEKTKFTCHDVVTFGYKVFLHFSYRSCGQGKQSHFVFTNSMHFECPMAFEWGKMILSFQCFWDLPHQRLTDCNAFTHAKNIVYLSLLYKYWQSDQKVDNKNEV